LIVNERLDFDWFNFEQISDDSYLVSWYSQAPVDVATKWFGDANQSQCLQAA